MFNLLFLPKGLKLNFLTAPCTYVLQLKLFICDFESIKKLTAKQLSLFYLRPSNQTSYSTKELMQLESLTLNLDVSLKY
jgi:hypothetical protein